MRFFKLLFIVLLLVTFYTISYAQNRAIVQVEQKIYKELSSWDKRIVFITSSMNPISELKEITNSEIEVGVWGIELYEKAKIFLDLSGLKSTEIKLLGNATHDSLFYNNSDLRIFITSTSFAEKIIKTGGGIEVEFVSESQSKNTDAEPIEDKMFNLITKNKNGKLSLWGIGLVHIINREPQLWQRDQLVLFKIDACYNDQCGKKGIVYRLNSNFELNRVGIFNQDLSMNDLENEFKKGTLIKFDELESPLTDIDGNTYKIITIGNQVWMAENLRVKHYRNGDPIKNLTNSMEWITLREGGYSAYEYDESNANTYGYLYNWYAAHDDRDIAPPGWHVPTDEDWKTLEKYLGISQNEIDKIKYRGNDEGGKLKDRVEWNRVPPGTTNESGFSAIPGGIHKMGFYFIGSDASFWSSTEYDVGSAWYRSLFQNYSTIYRNYDNKHYGFSIRLVRD